MIDLCIDDVLFEALFVAIYIFVAVFTGWCCFFFMALFIAIDFVLKCRKLAAYREALSAVAKSGRQIAYLF